MFEKLREDAKLKMKNDGLDVDIFLLEPKDRYKKGYWEGFIYGLDMAEKQVEGKIS